MAGRDAIQFRRGKKVILRVENLVQEFPVGRGKVVHAVSDISFDLQKGETLGIVGESGCGKSTTARAMVQLPPPKSGRVILDPGSDKEVDLTGLSGSALRAARPRLQMIFQDPISSLNPRRRISDIVGEGLEIRSPNGLGPEGRDRVEEVLLAVGIDPALAASHRPHQFSGGQCQRISIARALAVSPEILICDEPVSALDVSVQAKILNLLEDMKDRYALSLVFISHDLSVVRNVSDRIAVMYLGKLCEVGGGDAIYHRPAHPYTRVLLASAPEPASTVELADADIGDEIPSALDPPSGCRFRTRCPRATAQCADEEPAMRAVPGSVDHFVACHFPFT